MSGMFQNGVELETWLEYVPIRSEGNREQSFNRQFWCHDENLLAARYNIPMHQYDARLNFLFENAYLIESAVDQGRPIAINALEHCRVCVGYNNKHLLFADSWSTDYTESNASGSDRNIAGFSIVDKWLVYSWMRDVVSIKKIKTEKTEKKETKETCPEKVGGVRCDKKRRTHSELDVVDLTGATSATSSTSAAASATSSISTETCTISLLTSSEEEDDDEEDCIVYPPPLSTRISGIVFASGVYMNVKKLMCTKSKRN